MSTAKALPENETIEGRSTVPVNSAPVYLVNYGDTSFKSNPILDSYSMK